MYNCQTKEHHKQHCIVDALDAAQRLCLARGVKLTRWRKNVLEQIWQAHEAVKAYDLIRDLSSKQHAVKPPTVYRALEFLLAQGLIHRIESLNAYIGCPWPESIHQSCLLICTRCKNVEEIKITQLSDVIHTQLHQLGFHATQQIFEIQGLCKNCGQA